MTAVKPKGAIGIVQGIDNDFQITDRAPFFLDELVQELLHFLLINFNGTASEVQCDLCQTSAIATQGVWAVLAQDYPSLHFGP